MHARPYQLAALDGLFAYWGKTGGNPIVVAPTGSGKSFLLAELFRRLRAGWPAMRMLAVTHVRELIEQDFRALLRVWPAAPVGIYSAGLWSRSICNPITFCGIQSVYAKANLFGHIDVLAIDEAHLIGRRSNSMYGQFITALRATNPDMKIVGLSATPYRMDSGRLDRGSDRLFDGIAYEIGILELVESGFLAPLVTKATALKLDVSNVHTRGGEFIEVELQKAVDTDGATQAAVMEMIAYGADRRAWKVFCAGVDHAAHVAGFLRRQGVAAAHVHGGMRAGERDQIIGAFRSGALRALCSANMLTTGFDYPGIDLIGNLQPTKSTGKYVQKFGRGMRIADGKVNCIAEGQRVLTDRGLVPIECVTREMKVWDGLEFVTHSGILYRGEQETITYAGLTATHDHKVWTETGWQAFGECALAHTSISVASVRGAAIRTSESCFRRGCQKDAEGPGASARRMHDVRRAITKGLHKLKEVHCWLSKMREPATGSEMACYAGHIGETAMQESQGSPILRLRRTWDRISLFVTDSDGGLDSGNTRPRPEYGNRSHQQRWSLRSRKSSLAKQAAEPIKHAQAPAQCKDACLSNGASRNKVCRSDPSSPDRRWAFRCRDYRTFQPTVMQAKRRVWDILNAGPRHRFTAEGLLVSNCLVLDYARDIERHGPVDAVRVREPGEGGGAAPVKTCPECQSMLATAVRVCPDCGYAFPVFDPDARLSETASTAAVMSRDVAPEWLAVQGWRLIKHENAAKGDSVRIEYRCGMQVHKEWVRFDPNPSGRARQWWAAHGGAACPASVADALKRQGELRPPSEILVRRAGKYFEVASRRFVKEQEVAA